MRVLSMMEAAGVATRVGTTDTKAKLASGLLTKDGRSLCEIIVQCEPAQNNSARVTWGGTSPTQGASAIGIRMDPGDVYRIVGERNCASFEHISAVSGSASVLQIIPGY